MPQEERPQDLLLAELDIHFVGYMPSLSKRIRTDIQTNGKSYSQALKDSSMGLRSGEYAGKKRI